MALSVGNAYRVIQVVRADPEFVSRSQSIFRVLGRGAGGTRNFLSIMVAGDLEDSRNPWINWLCVGVAIAGADAVNRAIKARHLLGFESADSSHTSDGGHSATCVTMADKSQYVFDWWQTLNPDNPVLYRAKDFENHTFYQNWTNYGVQFRNFAGFD